METTTRNDNHVAADNDSQDILPCFQQNVAKRKKKREQLRQHRSLEKIYKQRLLKEDGSTSTEIIGRYDKHCRKF